MSDVVVVVGLQCLIITLLLINLFGVFKNMASLQEFKDDLNDIAVKVSEIADEIKALKDAGVGVISQADLDALDEKAEAIKAALDAAK